MPRDWPDPRFDKPFTWLERALGLVAGLMVLAGTVSLFSYVVGLLRSLFA